MNIEEIRGLCLQKKCVTEGFPFDNDTLVFKVCGKMFLLVSLSENPVRFNAKCEPGKAMELREKYSSILPGYHMNKQHWNTVVCDGTVPAKLVVELINHSYEIIVDSLPKKVKQQLDTQN